MCTANTGGHIWLLVFLKSLQAYEYKALYERNFKTLQPHRAILKCSHQSQRFLNERLDFWTPFGCSPALHPEARGRLSLCWCSLLLYRLWRDWRPRWHTDKHYILLTLLFKMSTITLSGLVTMTMFAACYQGQNRLWQQLKIFSFGYKTGKDSYRTQALLSS